MKKLIKFFTSRFFVDTVGIVSPLFMAIFAAVPLFFISDSKQLIQLSVVAYFLTIFLIKIVALLLNRRANRKDNIYLVNIAKGRIMFLSAIIILLEIIGIYVAFMVIIFQKTDPGFFGSSIIFALLYVAIFLSRLILNLVNLLTKRESSDYYVKTLTYIGTISLVYVMIVAINYMTFALGQKLLVFQTIFASIGVLLIVLICLLMLVSSILHILINKGQMRRAIFNLKKATKEIHKEEKIIEKKEKAQLKKERKNIKKSAKSEATNKKEEEKNDVQPNDSNK